MRTFPFSSTCVMFALVSWGIAGCGSGDETARYKLVPVSGTITLNGQPLEGALVTFTPDPENDPSTPGGDSTGPQGNYKAMYRGRSGLAPGKYKVTVSKTILPPGVTSTGGDDPYMAQLAIQGPGKKEEVKKIEGRFEGEVPPRGGTLDFNVEEKETPATKGAAKKR